MIVIYKRNHNFIINSDMDFGDELPCGGYEQEDKKIQNNLQQLSLESQGKKKQCECTKGCNSGCSENTCGNCECKASTKKEQKKMQPKKKVECKKCKQNQAVLIHKNEQICKECLLKSIQYKTRLTLQNKIKVKPDSKLLICFSGGLNSICLVKVLSNIKKRYQKSPLFGHLQCIHIQQQSKLPDGYVQNFQKQTEIKLKVIPIEDVYGTNKNKTFNDITNLFNSFKKNSNTIDLLVAFRNKLIRQYAQLNKFDYTLLATNGESLASQIFKYFTKGIGGSSPQLSSSQPSIFQYPLRQHLQKQLQYYFYHEKLSSLSMIAQEDDLSYVVYSQIDTFLNQFIITLQDRYSHTAPAIVRTGEKIRNNFSEEKQCKWCWLHHDRPGNLCQKCQRIKQSIKSEQTWKLMPEWTLN